MKSNRILVSNAEIGKFYFRFMPNGNYEAVKLISKTQYCGNIENAFGGKIIVPLSSELLLELDKPEEYLKPVELPPEEPIIQKEPVIRKTTSRTGIMDTIDSLLLNAPDRGYSAKELVEIILTTNRSKLTTKKLKYVIHSRIWYLRKFRGFENIASKRRYKLIPVPFKEE